MVVATKTPTEIVKRSGEVVQFDESKITIAIRKCLREDSKSKLYTISIMAQNLTEKVMNLLKLVEEVPTVEKVQDSVILVLQMEGFYEDAERYIIYRHEHTKMREAEYIPLEIKKAFEDSSQYFPTLLQEFQFFDKYSRYNYELGRRETWKETVVRAVDFLMELIGDSTISLYDIEDAILNMRVMPSMRLLAMAGPPARRNNVAIYNCSYLPIDGVDAFCEIMAISMEGCGVGFSVEFENVDKIPKVQAQHNITVMHHIVEDTTEGWIDAVRCGLTYWIGGEDVEFDLNLIRAKGSVLRTKGGRASGPEPLRTLLSFIRTRILSRQGKKLTTLDCHDIACAVGDAVVSGGVRRTAMISLFDFDDELMLTCKSGDFERDNAQRWNANNSAVWPDPSTLTQEQFVSVMWKMFESKRGEPGIYIRSNAQKLMPYRRNSERKFGTNPCFAPDTIIETKDGPKRIVDIKEPTYVYSMDENKKLVLREASASWLTRVNADTVTITLSSGKKLTVTPEHKIYVEGKGWREAGKLLYGNRLIGLCRSRRGAAYSGVKLTTQTVSEYQMEHRFIWEGINGRIPIGYDVHHKDEDTYANNLDNFELLSHEEHATLTRFRSANNHQEKDKVTGRFVSPFFSKGGAKTIVPMPDKLKSGLHQYATVVKVEKGPTIDVYDISVADTNNLVADGVIAHNCGEIDLRPWEFCNLSAVIARSDDTLESLKEKVRLATIIGTIQSMATDFSNLRSIWKVNCEEERLLGVDITGQQDCPILKQDGVFEELQKVAVETNKEWAAKLGISQSAAVTCVKPSGNTSTLVDCSSGLHARFARYYIRNVRVSATSPLVHVLRDAGIPLATENNQDPQNPYTYVVSFPVRAPDGAIVQQELSAIGQCEWWLKNKLNWTEHNPSVTITYGPEEVLDLMGWLWTNKEYIGGMSFHPKFDSKYAQLPYVEITADQYNELVDAMPKHIDFSRVYLYEKQDMTTAAQELACVSGLCMVE